MFKFTYNTINRGQELVFLFLNGRLPFFVWWTNSLSSGWTVSLRWCWIFSSCKWGQTSPRVFELQIQILILIPQICPIKPFMQTLLSRNVCVCQEEFKGMLEDAGFYCVQYHNLTAGVVALHSGFKLWGLKMKVRRTSVPCMSSTEVWTDN